MKRLAITGLILIAVFLFSSCRGNTEAVRGSQVEESTSVQQQSGADAEEHSSAANSFISSAGNVPAVPSTSEDNDNTVQDVWDDTAAMVANPEGVAPEDATTSSGVPVSSATDGDAPIGSAAESSTYSQEVFSFGTVYETDSGWLPWK